MHALSDNVCYHSFIRSCAKHRFFDEFTIKIDAGNTFAVYLLGHNGLDFMILILLPRLLGYL